MRELPRDCAAPAVIIVTAHLWRRLTVGCWRCWRCRIAYLELLPYNRCTHVDDLCVPDATTAPRYVPVADHNRAQAVVEGMTAAVAAILDCDAVYLSMEAIRSGAGTVPAAVAGRDGSSTGAAGETGAGEASGGESGGGAGGKTGADESGACAGAGAAGAVAGAVAGAGTGGATVAATVKPIASQYVEAMQGMLVEVTSMGTGAGNTSAHHYMSGRGATDSSRGAAGTAAARQPFPRSRLSTARHIVHRATVPP